MFLFIPITPTDLVNECDSAPCIHGGNCTDGLGRFDCECPQDYAGRQCELGKANYAFYLGGKKSRLSPRLTLLRSNAHILCFSRPHSILI